MGYQINLRGAVSRSIRRTYRRRLEKIGRVLAKAGPDAERIHEARTSVKKARALLRLLRHDLGASLFEAETAALREAGRALSTVRDAVVLVEALDGLTPEGSEEDRAALAPLRAALAARRDRCVERSDEEAARAARAVAGALERADEVVPAHHGWKALARGLDRAYRRTRDRAERAFTTGGDEDLHALRKAVKDLTYQARFLRPLDEPALRAEGGRLRAARRPARRRSRSRGAARGGLSARRGRRPRRAGAARRPDGGAPGRAGARGAEPRRAPPRGASRPSPGAARVRVPCGPRPGTTRRGRGPGAAFCLNVPSSSPAHHLSPRHRP